ncbi:MAG: hypothetical protein ACKVQR_16630 [Aquabacterium sp.]
MDKMLTMYPAPPGPARSRRGAALGPLQGLRRMLADLLQAAGAGLDRMARRLAEAEARAAAHEAAAVRDDVEALLEFHAEAGAPEGALYVNGTFVGHLTGVTRL